MMRGLARDFDRLTVVRDDATLTRLPPPQAGPQMEFASSEADIIVYGGSAGGGKSWSLLREPLKHVHHPDFGFVIFRRTSPQITNEGGLWDEAQKMYPLVGADGIRGILTWRFPSGAKGSFRHLQHRDTVLDWQGSQIPWIGFDELTHFDEHQFFYMLSRNRSTTGIPGKIRATTNPAPGWVKSFLSPWLDKTFEYPASSGELRWFVREKGEIHWVDQDHLDEDGQPPKSVTFIRSTVYDNKILLEKDPGYLTNLKSLPLVEQARLLHGDWDIFEGSFFDEWSESTHTLIPPFTPETSLPKHWRFFGGLDWGYADPFAFVLCAIDERNVIHGIESVQRTRLTNEGQANVIKGVLGRWGVPLSGCIIGYDPSMNARKTVNGVKGEPDIEAFYRAGLMCVASKNDPQHGNNLIRELLHTPGRYKVWKGYNADLIHVFPLAQYDRFDAEAMAHDRCSHLLAALRYGLSTRPRRPEEEVSEVGAVLPDQLRANEEDFSNDTGCEWGWAGE